jgi:hypothetical protein
MRQKYTFNTRCLLLHVILLLVLFGRICVRIICDELCCIVLTMRPRELSMFQGVLR